ncbi:hypothetical protein TNCV_3948881 [Trichonephila clavipes]|nr:hypothetical protein TNCV_3948881 [Trichonephila clavipes]
MQSYHQEVTMAGETVNSTRKAKCPTFPNPCLGEGIRQNHSSSKEVERRREGSIPKASLPQAARSSPPPSLSPPSAPSVEGALLEGTEEEDMELTQQDSLQEEIEMPVVPKKTRIPPFFISPKGDWRQLVALAKLKAPSFQSQMSGRFLKVTNCKRRSRIQGPQSLARKHWGGIQKLHAEARSAGQGRCERPSL